MVRGVGGAQRPTVPQASWVQSLMAQIHSTISSWLSAWRWCFSLPSTCIGPQGSPCRAAAIWRMLAFDAPWNSDCGTKEKKNSKAVAAQAKAPCRSGSGTERGMELVNLIGMHGIVKPVQRLKETPLRNAFATSVSLRSCSLQWRRSCSCGR